MSNLSDIGFPVRSERDVNQMIETLIEQKLEPIRCSHGFYIKYVDASGAEIYLQGSREQELVGFNPHYDGKSRRKVNLTQAIERDSSELDGGFHAWANPQDTSVENSGDYPFVFDVPDFRAVGEIEFPKICEIQLTAFASNDFKIFENEKDFYASQDSKPKLAAKSFIPSGLFIAGESGQTDETVPPRPIGIFAGEIKDYKLKTNELSGENFYWFLVETLGGEVDVVADVKLVPNEPQAGGIVRGQFWLSGRIINPSN